VKQHPGSAVLNFQAGILAIAGGPFTFGGNAARTHLEKAVKLAEASTNPMETSLLPTIKNALTTLNEMRSGPMGLPAFGGGPFPLPWPGPEDDFFDDDAFDDDDDDWDDDDFVPPWSSSAGSRPRPQKHKSKKKR
jgi:hypothetical protein